MMNSIIGGLKPDIVNRINTVFAKHPQIEKVMLYGSRAMGNYKNGSDIDLVIMGSNIDVSLLNRIIDELDDLLLPYTIDLSLYSHLDNKDLIDHIRRVGADFYIRDC